MYASLPLREGGEAAAVSYGPLQQATWKGFAYVYLPSLVAFVILDLAWIGLVAGKIYHSTLGDVLRDTPDPASGVLAWCCIVAACMCFALPSARSHQTAFVSGTFLGMLLYGTYEMTNQSILKPWTWGLALLDTAWGSFACGAGTTIQWWLQQRQAAAGVP